MGYRNRPIAVNLVQMIGKNKKVLSLMIDLLPGINASFNAASAICLLAGALFIRSKKIKLHRSAMASALFFSSCFLAGYLVYHAEVGSKPFVGTGTIRAVYFSILIPHTILATVMLPMIFFTFKRALSGDLNGHRKLARWTLPIWLYVSITGVVIYWMLYRTTWT